MNKTVPAYLARPDPGGLFRRGIRCRLPVGEQNASGLGTAYAGSAAVADNASTIF